MSLASSLRSFRARARTSSGKPGVLQGLVGNGDPAVDVFLLGCKLGPHRLAHVADRREPLACEWSETLEFRLFRQLTPLSQPGRRLAGAVYAYEHIPVAEPLRSIDIFREASLSRSLSNWPGSFSKSSNGNLLPGHHRAIERQSQKFASGRLVPFESPPLSWGFA